MSNDYAPTTERVRRVYSLAPADLASCPHTNEKDEDYAGAQFDRWLAKHDAEVRAELESKVAEFDQLKRGAKILGRIIERQGQDILNITRMHHLIGEDGDGDWGVVWETAHELLPRAEAAEAKVDRVEGLAKTLGHYAETSIRVTDREVYAIARDGIREALAGDPR